MKNYKNKINKIRIKKAVTKIEFENLLKRSIKWSEEKIDKDIEDPVRIELGFIFINSVDLYKECLPDNFNLTNKLAKKLYRNLKKEYKNAGFKVSGEFQPTYVNSFYFQLSI